MSDVKNMSSGMKSAYELALEKMESQGIDRPDENLSDEVRDEIAEIKSQAEARLAELEILHRDQAGAAGTPEQEEEYLRERRRIESRRDEKVERLRADR